MDMTRMQVNLTSLQMQQQVMMDRIEKCEDAQAKDRASERASAEEDRKKILILLHDDMKPATSDSLVVDMLTRAGVRNKLALLPQVGGGNSRLVIAVSEQERDTCYRALTSGNHLHYAQGDSACGDCHCIGRLQACCEARLEAAWPIDGPLEGPEC